MICHFGGYRNIRLARIWSSLVVAYVFFSTPMYVYAEPPPGGGWRGAPQGGGSDGSDDDKGGSGDRKTSASSVGVCSQSELVKNSMRVHASRKHHDGRLTLRDGFLSCLWWNPSIRAQCIEWYGCSVHVGPTLRDCQRMAGELVAARGANNMADLCRASGPAKNKLCAHLHHPMMESRELVDDACGSISIQTPVSGGGSQNTPTGSSNNENKVPEFPPR